MSERLQNIEISVAKMLFLLTSVSS